MHVSSFIIAAGAVAAATEIGTASFDIRSTETRPFHNLVSFGDSYTDNGRLNYYLSNNNTAPPAGTLPPQTNVTASGGLAWGQFVKLYTDVAYFDYAIGGASCSKKVTSLSLEALNGPFPSVVEDELPSFVADVGAKSLYANRTAENTVYTVWVGTNDVGKGGFLTDSQVPGANITTYTDCLWSVFDTIYSTGGRRFVLFNMAPLQLAPLYTPQAEGGAGDGQYWSNKTAYNQTEYQGKILEYTVLINRILDYGAPVETLLRSRWPGVTMDIFDVHSLLTDVYHNPSAYLESPANSTGYYIHCDAVNTSECTRSTHSLETFMWYDELHPSNQTERVIAREFIKVLAGNSTFGTRVAE